MNLDITETNLTEINLQHILGYLFFLASHSLYSTTPAPSLYLTPPASNPNLPTPALNLSLHVLRFIVIKFVIFNPFLSASFRYVFKVVLGTRFCYSYSIYLINSASNYMYSLFKYNVGNKKIATFQLFEILIFLIGYN